MSKAKQKHAAPRPVRTSSVTTAVELVTPEKAGDWLSLNTNNRKLSDRTVRRYAGAMERGEWLLNGEAIQFTKSGKLINGQHRLTAVIVAKTPVSMVIVRGIDDNAYDTIDAGKGRSLKDALTVRGEGEPYALGAILPYVYRYQTVGTFSRRPGFEPPTTKQLEAALDENPEVRRVMRGSYAMSRKLNITQGVAGCLRYITDQIDNDDSEEFWESVFTGVDLAKESPILRLRERLLERSKATPDYTAAISIKAWNAWRKGGKIQALGWRDNEPFPKPE